MSIATLVRVATGSIAVSLFLALAGCDSGGSSKSVAAPPDTAHPVVAAGSWSVEGTFQFPSKETARHLKIVATVDPTVHAATRFASAPVPLVVSGATPTASFRLEIDPSLATGVTSPNMISLIVFQDTNENGVNDAGEKSRQVIANAGSTVWCDEGQPCTSGANFMLVSGTVTGTGTNGSYTLTTPGWYYQKGCRDYSCAHLIAASSRFSGLLLGYSYYNDAPIDTTTP